MSDEKQLLKLIDTKLSKHPITLNARVKTKTKRGQYTFYTLQNGNIALQCVLRNSCDDLPKDAQIEAKGKLKTHRRDNFTEIQFELWEWSLVRQFDDPIDNKKRELAKRGVERVDMPIPNYLTHIALITSAYGSVINDFKAKLNSDHFVLKVFPSSVEGSFAETNLVNQIEAANEYANDHPGSWVIAIIRGGGNVDVFNTTSVAEQICHSNYPVVSAIGHAEYRSLIDEYVARHFITPTDLATHLQTKTIVPTWNQIIDQYQHRLNQRTNKLIEYQTRLKLTTIALFNQTRQRIEADLSRKFDQINCELDQCQTDLKQTNQLLLDSSNK